MQPGGVQPYICINEESGGAMKAIAWYKDVFGATVRTAMAFGQDNKQIGHAELDFGGSIIMLSDAFPGMGLKSPKELGGTPINLTVMYQAGTAQSVYEKAISKGATVTPGKEFKAQPWGWSSGGIQDPFGYEWTVGEDSEKLSNEQISERLKMVDVAGQF